METTITSKGQVTLPKALREKLRLKAGQKLVFFERQDGCLGFHIRRDNLDAVIGILKPTDGRTRTVEEMTEAARQAAAESVLATLK